ncbi:restriction endonuclease [Pseudaeromonas sharmana]|uniref:Restriction endonuclease n=1 Tax=Pseudaeromonas sharmana TaxID=328412 RepID=A0ABV8CKL1_9GAMM
MAYIELNDFFTSNSKDVVVTGLSVGCLSLTDTTYLVTHETIMPVELSGIEIDRKIVNSCEDNSHVGILLRMNKPYDFNRCKTYIEETNETVFQAFISTDINESKTLQSMILDKNGLIEELVTPLFNEADTYRDVLIRKYQQLSFTDEYDEIDDSQFITEAKKFILKKLGYSDSKLEFCSRILTSYIAELASDEPEDIDFNSIVSPYEYETLCSRILKENNWKSFNTPKSGDQGADVIAEKNGKRIVLQCKMYNQPVGNKAVQEIFFS